MIVIVLGLSSLVIYSKIMGCCCSATASYRQKQQWPLWFDSVEAKDERIEILPDTKEAIEEASKVFALSFGGTAQTAPEGNMDWALGENLRGKFSDPDRCEFFRQAGLLSAHLNFAGDGVSFAVYSAKANSSSNREMLAVLHVRPPGTMCKNGSIYDCRSICRLSCARTGVCSKEFKEICSPVEESSGFQKRHGRGAMLRTRKLNSMMPRIHHETMGARDHWYVFCLAVRPDAQGKKCARGLLDLIHHLADREKVPCYLETCGARCISIYERLGYTDFKKDYDLGEGLADDVKEGGNICTAMVREPRPYNS